MRGSRCRPPRISGVPGGRECSSLCPTAELGKPHFGNIFLRARSEMSSAGLFPPDAVIRKVDGEVALLLGGGRALLMQLAHPLVAKGVAEHSGFESAPLARLERTLAATYTVVFGPTTEAT